jgi:hypothetical protein
MDNDAIERFRDMRIGAEDLRARGAMREFTKMYKRRRLAAGLRGEGFMSYANAELRLRKALVPLLQGNGNVATASLFASDFGS